YGAGHAISPSRQATEVKRFDVVGPVCESADCFARGLELPELNAGEFIAIADTGAYGRSMSSTYNLRALPKEILLTKKGELLDITPP
ncbi:MAG: hypothetical protein KC478_16710, partial [Bacteriovoracaceae bacterium]|nr:hypothetical protein [Bacteriovoracaceae bacterium]